MQFQIRFPNGERVPLGTLNAEAANLWGIGLEMANVVYVYPPEWRGGKEDYGESNNWYEVIGTAIIYPTLSGITPMQQNWGNIKETLFNNMVNAGNTWELEYKSTKDVIISIVDYLKPYYELIDLWYSKGYVPIKIK